MTNEYIVNIPNPLKIKEFIDIYFLENKLYAVLNHF